MQGRGCAWQGVCMAGGLRGGGHAWQGVHGGGHAWQGGVCGRGACVAGGVHGRGGMHVRGACMAGGMHGRYCDVRILLECILVLIISSQSPVYLTER